MRGRGILFHGPVNSGEAGDTDLNPKLCWPKYNFALYLTWRLVYTIVHSILHGQSAVDERSEIET